MRKFTLVLIILLCSCSIPRKKTPQAVESTLAYHIYSQDSVLVETIDHVSVFDSTKLDVGLRINSLIWNKWDEAWYLSIREGDGSEIYRYRSNKLTRITSSPYIMKDAISIAPGGKALAFVGNSNFSQDIFYLDLITKKEVCLTPYPSTESNIQWDSTGKIIYFRTDYSGLPNIYKIGVDGKGLANISNGSGVDGAYAVSPDGKWLAVVTDRFNSHDLALVNLESGEVTRMTENGSNISQLSWSANGNYLVYTDMSNDGASLYLFNRPEKKIITLTPPDIFSIMPVWSPDYSSIAFTGTVNNNSDIYTVDLEGKIQRQTNTPDINESNAIYIAHLE